MNPLTRATSRCDPLTRVTLGSPLTQEKLSYVCGLIPDKEGGLRGNWGQGSPCTGGDQCRFWGADTPAHFSRCSCCICHPPVSWLRGTPSLAGSCSCGCRRPPAGGRATEGLPVPEQPGPVGVGWEVRGWGSVEKEVMSRPSSAHVRRSAHRAERTHGGAQGAESPLPFLQGHPLGQWDPSFLEVLGGPRIKNKINTEFKAAATGNSLFPPGWER